MLLCTRPDLFHSHHHLDLVRADTARSPGWRSRVYRAIKQWATNEPMWERWRSIYNGTIESGPTGRDAAESFLAAHSAEMLEGTRVLWPERESYEQLMVTRLVEGQASFDAEKQNHPVDPERALFRARDILYWDDHHIGEAELIATLRGSIEIHAACDPSLGRAGRHNDDTSIIVLLRHVQSGVLYVLEADIAKRTPDQTIDWLINLGKRRRLTRLSVETNQFQDFLASEVSRRSAAAGVNLPVQKVAHTSDKHGRIQSLQPLVVNGTLRFSRKHSRLIEQLVQFPMAAHDDGPDALELAIGSTRACFWYVSDPDTFDPSPTIRERKETYAERMIRLLHDEDHPTWKEIARW
ncbi:MAG: phage terminase large subunit [Phycisphaeraceae bacterium]|nr:phage terminase large subunit [Phycisphaeraceae bacterium]